MNNNKNNKRAERRERTRKAVERKQRAYIQAGWDEREITHKTIRYAAGCRCDYCLPAKNRVRSNERREAVAA